MPAQSKGTKRGAASGAGIASFFAPRVEPSKKPRGTQPTSTEGASPTSSEQTTPSSTAPCINTHTELSVTSNNSAQSNTPPNPSAFSAMMAAARRKAVPVSFHLQLQQGSDGAMQWQWSIHVEAAVPAQGSKGWSADSTIPPRRGLQHKGTCMHLTSNVPSGSTAAQGAFSPCMAPSLLKSILQKAVRRRQVPQAMKAAVQLWHHPAGGQEHLVRRLQIIAVEDAIVHAAAPAVAWCMLALAKGYRLSTAHLHLLVAVAAQLATSRACEQALSDPPVWKRVLQSAATVSVLPGDGAGSAAHSLAADLKSPPLRFIEGGGESPLALGIPPPVCTLPDLLLMMMPKGGEGGDASMAVAAGAAVACWLRASHGGMRGDVAMMHCAARRWAYTALSVSKDALEDAAQPAGSGMCASQQCHHSGCVVCCAFTHGAQVFVYQPSVATWSSGDVPKVKFGVDMHNDGQNAFPAEAVTVGSVAAGEGGGQWRTCAAAMLLAGISSGVSFRRDAASLLWKAWSGTNARRPGRLTAGFTPAVKDAAAKLVEAFEPEAMRRIKLNAFVPAEGGGV